MLGIDQKVPSNNHAENQNSLKIGTGFSETKNLPITCKRIFTGEERLGASLCGSFIRYGHGLKP